MLENIRILGKLKSVVVAEENRALIAIFLASVFYALVPILLRVSEAYFNPISVVFNRGWISACFLSLIVLIRRGQNSQVETVSLASPENLEIKKMGVIDASLKSLQSWLSKNLLWTLASVGASYFGTQLLWAWSIDQTTVANSEVLHSLSPPVTVLVSWVLFSQTFGRRFILGVAFSTVGTIAILANDMSSAVNFRGDSIALLSALFYAAYLMSVEKLRERWDSINIVLWGMVATVMLCMPVFLATDEIAFSSLWRGWLSLILFAIDSTATLLLITYSLKTLSSALTATVLLISPCLTALLGWLFFSETLGWLNVCGFVIVLAGIYFSVSGETEA